MQNLATPVVEKLVGTLRTLAGREGARMHVEGRRVGVQTRTLAVVGELAI
jgi:hypothetical protein